MNKAPQTLPDNTELLQQIIKNQQAMILSLQAQIAALKRHRFGKSSEKFDHKIEQLELMLDEMAYQGVNVDIPKPDQGLAKTPKSKPTRQKLPEDLPREEIVHAPKECCPECGSEDFSKIGEDITEVLDYVPAHFKVLRHVRPKYSCRECEAIRQAELPSMPITKGKAASGLLAHIIISKYCDHLPLYRQSEIYARQNIHISRSTMAGWMRQIDDLIEPLSKALRRDTLSSNKLHGDDTTVPVLTPERQAGFGFMCVMIAASLVKVNPLLFIVIALIVKAFIRKNTSKAIRELYKPMVTPDTMAYIKQIRWIISLILLRRLVGRMRGGNSMKITKTPNQLILMKY